MASDLGRRLASELGAVTLEKVCAIGLENARRNALAIASGKSILALRSPPLSAQEAALVIAAGPSLHRRDTAKIIKEAGFDGTLIATESALSYCLRHDIVPDLVVTLDPHPDRIVRWFGDPKLDRSALAADDYFARQDMDPKFTEDQLRANDELIRLVNAYGPRIRLAVASCASTRVVERAQAAGMDLYWWNPMYDDDEAPHSLTRKLRDENRLPCLNAGGNVGSAAWVMAHAVLRKRRVGLCGMDLGYYGDTPYERTQYYREILALVGPERLDEVFIRINNPHLGTEFFTDPTYYWYREAFLEMAQVAECETWNCTGGGILFGAGIRWDSLDNFLGQGAHRWPSACSLTR